jgi:hypothetical protein
MAAQNIEESRMRPADRELTYLMYILLRRSMLVMQISKAALSYLKTNSIEMRNFNVKQFRFFLDLLFCI